MGRQYSQGTTRLTPRLDDLKQQFEAPDLMFAELESEVDRVRRELYRDSTPTIRELPPVDLNTLDQQKTEAESVPPPQGGGGRRMCGSSRMCRSRSSSNLPSHPKVTLRDQP